MSARHAAASLLVALSMAGCLGDRWVTVSPRDAAMVATDASDAALPDASRGDASPVDVPMGARDAPIAVPCLRGPTALYRGEDNARDSAGGRHALHSTVEYASGHVGQAFSFGGTLAEPYIELPASVGDFGSGNFAITFWFNTTNTTEIHSLLSKRAACWGGAAFTGLDLRVAYNGRLFLELWSTTGPFSVGSLPGYNDGRWHQVAIVRQEALVHLAVDGVIVGSIAFTGSMTDPSRTPFYVGVGRCVPGAPGSNGTQDGTAWFNGRLDELAFYDRALSEGELTETAQGRCPN